MMLSGTEATTMAVKDKTLWDSGNNNGSKG